jgi:hypothetical protein
MDTVEKHHNPTTRDIEKSSLSGRITGKELEPQEELRVQIGTLVEILDRKGILDKKEYQRTVSMRLHETSKALAIEGLSEEL